ncbi:MAG: hypothetical protein ACYCV7_07820 [Acidimicrobiales bacterium]
MEDVLEPIRPGPMTPVRWAPYGWLPVPDTDPSDGTGRLAFDWDDAHVNLISHRRDEVPEVPGGLRCERLFRHTCHTQVLMSLDAAAVIVVAPAGSDPTAPGGVGDGGHPGLAAFALDPLTPVVLHRGTWHWGPYPESAESVQLLNVQGLRYREDNECADLGREGRSVDVLLGRCSALPRVRDPR